MSGQFCSCLGDDVIQTWAGFITSLSLKVVLVVVGLVGSSFSSSSSSSASSTSSTVVGGSGSRW